MESPSSSSLGALIALLRCDLFEACDISDLNRRALLTDFASREFNAFLWVSLIGVTVFLFLRLVEIFRLWREADLIAGPPCSSLYGHCELLSRKSLNEVLSDSHKKYGSVVKLWLGATQLLVSFKDPKLIKELLSKATDKIPSTGKTFNLAFGRSSLFVSSFSEGQKQGEAFRAELSERLLQIKNDIHTKFIDCTERIDRYMVKGSVNCEMVSKNLAFTIMGTTLYGDAFSVWPKANVYEELLMTITKDACFWASYNFTPFWNRGFWKYRRLCTELKCLTREIVQQGKKSLNLFHCAHLGEREEEETLGNFMGMMFHGSLTTSGMINGILVRLVQHPKLQDEIYTEISKAQKDTTFPADQNFDKMPLLSATVYEASRLLPAGPLLQRCSLDRELILKNGMTVPAGAVLVVPVQLVQEDRSIWGNDACEFNPYRFLSPKKTTPNSGLKTSLSGEVTDLKENAFVVNEPINDAAFLTFGSGIRACVGEKFVIKAVVTLFASLLRCYEIKLLPEAMSYEKPKMNNCGSVVLLSSKIAFLKRNN